MSDQQQSKTMPISLAGQVEISEGQALTLEFPVSARLRVTAGRVWLTGPESGASPATAPDMGRDIVLVVGEETSVPAHCPVVLEGWPQARFELVLEPQAAFRRTPRQVWRRVFARGQSRDIGLVGCNA